MVGTYLLLWALGLALESGWEGLASWLSLSPQRVHLQPWTLLTMALVHRDPVHLLFNALALGSLGPYVERGLGSRRYGILVGVAALSGSLLYVLWGLAWGSPAPAIGASGAVLGVLVAFALQFPDAELRVFLAAPLKARNLPWLIVGIDLIALAARQPIAVTCHLGGMLGAWIFLRKPWTPSWRRSFRLRWRRLTGGLR
jgi:membrane associated rhomboid family serine protease